MPDITDNHIVLRFVESGASLYRIISVLKVRDSAFDSNLRQLYFSVRGIEPAESSASAKSILPRLSPKTEPTVTQE
jgi:circadian clock protein KaiC